ncbi:GTPase Era [Sulfuriferula nivalis]|uniref:GTPase Era n=1 Tax=Sulfuriferula nivalis TaxID=2675298 RepID=A0A809S837_9PROT|nr:GTPase Era [Sulfuriferula nivalis]BBP00223.1 GTPase Era [Sulfuriferula nivalis]
MNPSNPDFRTGYIAIIGRPNVGKSTLTNHIVGAKVSITSRKAQTTRHRIHGIYTDADAQYIFVDTPGFQTQYDSALNRGMNKTVVDALHSTDVVLFVIEGTRFDSRDQKVVDLLPKDIPVILVLNKQDLVKDKDSLLPFMAEMNEIFPFAAIVPISARNGEQVPRLLTTIRSYLPVAEAMFDEDDITDKSERFLAAEMVREKVFRLSGEEVPYSASVMIEKFEQEGDMRRVFATILVDKENQKAIIIGHQGSKLKEIGTAARLDMERLFGGKVYLELWVKVKGGWADSERILKQLGYD